MDDDRMKNGRYFGKDYLTEEEVKDLESAISGYFDYIERIIKNHTTFTMQSLANSVNKFLEFNKYKIQKIEADFDKEMKKVLEGNK